MEFIDKLGKLLGWLNVFKGLLRGCLCATCDWL